MKEWKEEELYKKCGFKKPNDFAKQVEWPVKIEGIKYIVSLYAKVEGKANTENKYEFPPPVDSTLFYGNCSLSCMQSAVPVSLSVGLWGKMYEKLYGGFEDLAATAVEDELEIDELANIPSEKKTKDGYLKDGFVVDSDGEGVDDEDEDEDDEEDDDEESDELEDSNEDDLEIEDIGSELSSDEYELSSDEEEDEEDDEDDSGTGDDSTGDSTGDDSGTGDDSTEDKNKKIKQK